MTFQEQLNAYMTQIPCTGKDLAEQSGLSPAFISRCRAGSRVPPQGSEQLSRLASGLVALAGKTGKIQLTEDAVLQALSNLAEGPTVDFERIVSNLNQLISALDLSLNELARFMSYDASFISRIRTGTRRPSDPDSFVDSVCRFVVRRRAQSADREAVAALMDLPASDLAEENSYFSLLKDWFYSGAVKPSNPPDQISSFLAKLDEFDLNEYIRLIHFDHLKIPSVPLSLPTARNYYGLDEMKEGELNFFKATVLSRSTEPVFMCSDMEMDDMADDLEFGKKWMLGIAMMLKKGLHLHTIHNIDRPFKEMMLGLESWVPIYMTGQVSPYYLKGERDSVYGHLNYVSGAAALTGECITGYHKKAKYYLTKNKEEVTYYREKADFLLKQAHPLMNIYRSDSEKAYQAFLLTDAETEGARRGTLSAPPLYTISEELLRRILKRNAISEADQAMIMKHAAMQRMMAETVLAKNTITDEILRITEEEFSSYPLLLSLEGVFYEKDVFYSFEEYTAHINETREFERTHPNYRVISNSHRVFRHLQILFHESDWAMISKSKSPAIHFVIRHPKLREALENFILPSPE